MGQVIRLLREGNELQAIADDVLTKIDELPTASLLEALSRCQKIRQQITVLFEVAVSAEKMIDRIECRTVRYQLYEQQSSSQLELTNALGRISRAIHALNIALLGRQRNNDPK